MEKQYYWDLLKQVKEIEDKQFANGIPVQRETMNLKGLAFCGLIRLDESFQIETNADEIEQIKAEQQKRIISNDKIKIPDLVENIKIRNMDNTVYSLDLQFFKDMMKSDYKKYVEKSNQQAQVQYDELDDFTIPDLFSEADDLIPSEAEVTEVKTQKAEHKPEATGKSKIRNEGYFPAFVGQVGYNNDPQHHKNLNTFCVNQVRLVYQEGSQHAVVDFNIFPLTFNENEDATDIMVVAVSGNAVRAGMSRGITTHVKIEFEQLGFMARGAWRNGEFKTNVVCLQKEFSNKFQSETTSFMPDVRTYTTYMQERFNRTTYSFFPAMIGQNGPDGTVPAAMVFELEGSLQIMLSNEKNSFSILDDQGLPIELSLYWTGGKTPQLVLSVDED